jgi:hypothetical protein
MAQRCTMALPPAHCCFLGVKAAYHKPLVPQGTGAAGRHMQVFPLYAGKKVQKGAKPAPDGKHREKKPHSGCGVVEETVDAYLISHAGA